MKHAVIYIHGKNGHAEEADHYRPVFPDSAVIGFDYKAQTPWEAGKEFPVFFDSVIQNYQSVSVIANSIGAFFTMNALSDKPIEKAFFISPVVDMEKLICNMMQWANISEEELQLKGQIETEFNETLSWEYLCYVREYPICWQIPTYILYGEKDNLTSPDTITDFVSRTGAELTIMKNGEHWFHTKEQMVFLDNWISHIQSRN